MEHYKPYTLPEYIELLGKHQLGPRNYPIYNPDLLEELVRQLQRPVLRYTAAAEVIDHPIYLTESGVPISRAFTGSDTNYTIALADLVSHVQVPYGWGALVTLAMHGKIDSGLRDLLVRDKTFFATDTLTLDPNTGAMDPEGDPDLDMRPYAWIHSPVADVSGSYEDWLGALASRRRRKVVQSTRQWDGYQVQSQLLTMDEVLGFCLPNLRVRRRYQDFGHSVRQMMVGHLASFAGHHMGRMFTVRNNGALVAAYYYIHNADTAIYQGMVKDESVRTDGIGMATLAYAIRHYCENQDEGISRVDPTCITQPFEDEHSIDNYKRTVVTASNYLPTFMLGVTADDLAHAKPPFYNGVENRFVLPEDGGCVYTPDRFPDVGYVD